jgi:RNA polymerase sigma factor (TIGR02999 family)
MASSTHEVTLLLQAWNNGDEAALAQLIPLVESELHRLASAYMRGESANNTLQPTALMNEAWLRLIDWKNVEWQNRAHFFGVSAQIMRRVLVDHARRRKALKQGGDAVMLSLTNAKAVADEQTVDVIALNDALNSLATFDERKSRIIELRFFGGLTEEETAEVLKISLRTLQREWNMARAWLFRTLSPA